MAEQVETMETTEVETAADTEQVDTEQVNPEDQDNDQVDADKTVAKLQKRIGKEHAEKQDYKSKLDEALKQIEDLKSGKSIKKLSEEEKATKAEDEKAKRIAELEGEIARSKSIKETDSVFKEAGLNVDDSVLNMVVANDNDKTYANAKALINFANSVQEQTRQGYLKGKTPKETGNTGVSDPFTAKIAKYK